MTLLANGRARGVSVLAAGTYSQPRGNTLTATAVPDMSEFDAVAPARGVACWFSKLDGDQKAKVRQAKMTGYSGETIAKVVRAWGVYVRGNSVLTHFREHTDCA